MVNKSIYVSDADRILGSGSVDPSPRKARIRRITTVLAASFNCFPREPVYLVFIRGVVSIRAVSVFIRAGGEPPLHRQHPINDSKILSIPWIETYSSSRKSYSFRSGSTCGCFCCSVLLQVLIWCWGL
ncbi:hypothetical protein AVEN_208699-1 [Araneus ventricosus]|uniref:Uncharacterized protein n=1 Tax=Araneus ventricosus TaxID=182803 RepID=A0A4Y2FFX0_ARAVE|nr:hypothetical protein AVEN_208699-1 [Araneus ventricosus]